MKFKAALDRFIQYSIALLMGVMVMNVTWQVVSRYLLGDPSSFTDELSRYSMIWLGLLGAAYVSGKNGHLAIDLMTNRVQGERLFFLQCLIHGLVIFFGAVVLVWGGGNLVYISQLLQQKSATLQVPLSWVYGILPISGLLVVYYHGFHLAELLKNRA